MSDQGELSFTDPPGKSGICPHCHAKMVEYRHSLSIPLVTGLGRLYRHAGGQAVNLIELELTRNQWDNFQKLRYWGLVKKARNEDGGRMAGWWQLTEKGRMFLTGELRVPPAVWTYRGEMVRWSSEPQISAKDVVGFYLKREDYAASAIPVDPQAV